MRILLAAVIAGSLAPAQRMAVAGDDERVVQLFDLGRVLVRLAAREPNAVEKSLSAASLRRKHRDELVAAVRRFVEPPLTLAEDVAPLTAERVVVLAGPEQAAWVEQFVTWLGEVPLDRPRYEQVELVHVPVEAEGELAMILGVEVAQSFAADFATAGAQRLNRLRQTGKVVCRSIVAHMPLQIGAALVGQNVAFRQDWRRVDGTLKPLLGEVFDGSRLRVQRVDLPDDRVAWWVEAEFHAVQKPMATRQKPVGGATVAVDVPEVATVRLEGIHRAAAGRTVVLGSRSETGALVAIVQPMGR